MARNKKKEIRQKRTLMENGYMEYLDVDLIPLYETTKGPRADPAQESTVIQRNLNDRNSKRLFHRRACHNFGPGDLFLTTNYTDEFLPPTWKQAERDITNFIRRYNDLRRSLGLPRTKYLIVTECTTRQSGEHEGEPNFHHHLLISGGVDRDTVEGLWRRRRRKGELEGRPLGTATTKRLHFDKDGIEGLMLYFYGDEKSEARTAAGQERQKHKRRWRGSKNLVDPKPKRPNDTRWSDALVTRLAEEMQDNGKADPAYWEKEFPGYRFSRCRPEFNNVTGRWSIYLRMHRRL